MADTWLAPQPAVLTAIRILEEAFDPVRVSSQMPRTRPPMFVRVTRIGGGQTNPVTDIARILVECWGPGIASAESMANTARAALRNAAGITFGTAYVRSFSNEQGPVDFPDPDVPDMTRFQFFGDLNLSTKPAAAGS
jgi:hypothetical protein